ncbi:hypothetical protein [Gymnodinialimonas hymeniacidonis]|uniref:hypothetical protein n=1 Tax=Gymnodinialimonas hymeniacidonis TaxID=3126508 RepID=UPI0034C6B707
MRVAYAFPLLLGACIGGAAPSVPDGPVYPVAFDARGIDVVGSGQRIDFGRAQAGVIETMTRLQGSAPTLLPCDRSNVTAARWRDGPLLVFRNGSFVGHGSPGSPGQAGETCAPLAVN